MLANLEKANKDLKSSVETLETEGAAEDAADLIEDFFSVNQQPILLQGPTVDR